MAGQALATRSLQQHPCTHRDEQNLAGCWVWRAGYLPSPQLAPMAMVMTMLLPLDKAILKLIFFFLFWAVLEEAKKWHWCFKDSGPRDYTREEPEGGHDRGHWR